MKLLLPWRIFQSLSLSGRLGLIVTLFWLVIALFGTWWAPHSLDDIGSGPLMGGFTPKTCWAPIIWGGICSRALCTARNSRWAWHSARPFWPA